MKATAAISIAALVAALTATPSMSLDLNAGAGVSAGAAVSGDDVGVGLDVGADLKAGAKAGGDLGVDTSATGAIAANASSDDFDVNARLDALIKLINESDYDDTSFRAWADASGTTVINIDDLFDLDGKAQIDAAIQANLDEHNDLSAAIDANAALKTWLDSHGIDASSIIAIDVSADGSVDVYEG